VFSQNQIVPQILRQTCQMFAPNEIFEGIAADESFDLGNHVIRQTLSLIT
jgi:hypothetical protein